MYLQSESVNLLHVCAHFQINPFHTTDLFLHLLKISENRRFSDIFRGYRKWLVPLNGLWNPTFLQKLIIKVLKAIFLKHYWQSLFIGTMKTNKELIKRISEWKKNKDNCKIKQMRRKIKEIKNKEISRCISTNTNPAFCKYW